MDKQKLVCINRDLKYKHHQKIEIGKVYLGYYGRGSVVIYEISSGKYIGCYHMHNFETIDLTRDKKLEQLI